MDKAYCDKLICEYTDKLYGFALTKTHSIDHAEELASRITLEVYTSLLRREDIQNVNTYIYRVAQNVWARYSDEYRRLPYFDIFENDIPDGDDFTERVADSEAYAKLRLEIVHLSKVRREILMLRYYNNMKLDAIAKKLGIPAGTVKWHLNGAKSSLKKGMDTMRNIGKLGLSPIEFVNMGHDGCPGAKGDTRDFLSRRITQNVAYAAYRKARTINEIADELGISPIFVSDEVATLEEYGFMDKVGEKYLTNILITVPTKEWDNKRHEIFCRFAAHIRELYIPRVIEALKDFDRSTVYIPGGDENLFLWSGIAYALGSDRTCTITENEAERFMVARKDGGNYIAFADVVTDFEASCDRSIYSGSGDMYRGSSKYPIRSWQNTTIYDTRKNDWRENLYTDFEYLYEFYTKKITKTPENIEKYERIRTKGYITSDDRVNVICIKSDGGRKGDSALEKSLPIGGSEMDTLADALAEEIYELDKIIYPEHMLPLCNAYSNVYFRSNDIRMRVIEQLVADGTLKLPEGEAAAGLTTLLFTDILPE
nr:sigma-70 family RNA polymerase sigma factor [Clostridia bacterium]